MLKFSRSVAKSTIRSTVAAGLHPFRIFVLNGPVQVLFLGIVFSEQRKLTACNLCDLMLAEKAKYPAAIRAPNSLPPDEHT